jgi:3-methyladenine DNA glycosylase AlkD
MSLITLEKEIVKVADKKRALSYSRYFKTKKGQYAYGDIFLGISVPQCRLLAKKYVNLNFKEISKLLNSAYHEKRLIALIILIELYNKKGTLEKDKIFKFYLKNKKAINNWDLVDISAYKILGDYLYLNPSKKSILYKLIKSSSLWDRRIAIVATYSFIKNNQLKDTLKLASFCLRDKEDLIHKAVGWMLRELGLKDKKILLNFLEKYSKMMPRVMLRYSLEKFSKPERRNWLKSSLK